MRMERLVLKNFRNYSDLSWYPHPSINIITGDNAQGKTNLLEAIFFCTAGRSFRTARDKDIIKWQEEECFINVTMDKKRAPLELSACLNNSENTMFFLNGSKMNKNRIFQPCLSVAFTPADIDLIRGSPSERRRWVDLELGPYDVQYLFNLKRFEKVLYQRNNLLKCSVRGKSISGLIEPWNEQMFLYGSRIINTRMELLRSLFPHLRDTFAVLTAGKEEISFKYVSSIPLERGMRLEEIEKVFRDTVRKKAGLEILRQQTLFGPHRDDVVFYVNGEEVRKFGSGGQQRSVLLALKLSLMKLYFEEYNEYPVLLLDDVFLELDRQRQQGLDNLLREEGQVFITSNRVLTGYFAGQAKTFEVSRGKISGG
jgi:DNA replication and repair protein RecF